MKRTVCELFAGVGGFRLGLERSSPWVINWANQWEPNKGKQHAFDCYVSHFTTGEHVNEDIAKVDTSDIPGHTLLVGGFPCQDYSVAKTGAEGITGKKGILWWEIRRILEKKHPPFVLLENVDRLLKSPAKQRGRDFGVLLACLRDLDYSVEWRVINAADYGFPQKRRRIFIFAFKNDTEYFKRVESDSLCEWSNKSGFFQKVFPIKGDVNMELGPYDIELDGDLLRISDRFVYNFKNSGIMTKAKLYTKKVEPMDFRPSTLGSVLENNINDKYFLSEDELEQWEYMKGAKKERRKTKGGFEYKYAEGAIPHPDPLDTPARTMLTSEGKKNRSTHIIQDPENGRLRILTPVECERLNGFDDNWTDTGMPESFRYFCMGNALVVGLIERMGKELLKIVELE